MPAGPQACAQPAAGLYYNAHVGAIFEDFEQNEYEAVLREIERHVRDWERQQRPEQAEWLKRQRLRGYRSVVRRGGEGRESDALFRGARH